MLVLRSCANKLTNTGSVLLSIKKAFAWDAPYFYLSMIRDDLSDEGSELSAPGSCVPDVRYQDLKRRISAIKVRVTSMVHADVVPAGCWPCLQAQRLLQESQCSQALEIAADLEEWAKERLQFRAIQSEQQGHVAELKSHLASVIDRTTRIRNAYEKEKKQLQSQASFQNTLKLVCLLGPAKPLWRSAGSKAANRQRALERAAEPLRGKRAQLACT